ncbi:hypothetical protein BmR1_04g08000 [Babesia microti strain RI]|uniref:Uncharacterized protein n=1 Tax=Babesia microti (strain RI) TaxID=1133968 RepID=A0A1N6LY47_BABMR|nr:hypothetical protein BmR1_04g08000 [Babesia microti strain RI]SIO73782.1 hypothetical protein BmR1_04g08000 [Babesia microti strain RI]|eukprot:XP_021337843.1 hypothetical protein BmR1_04g08000 [Babesia microti strain RI]
MCKVIDDIYKVQGWTDTQPLDLESLKLILAALFIAPPDDIIEQILSQNGSINKSNLAVIIQELKQYKLRGSNLINLIKEFSVDNKINIDLLNTILIENGMNERDLDELLLVTMGDECKGNDVDINKFANGLDSLSGYEESIV